MKSMQPEPSIRMYNNLMSVSAKIEQYSFALNVFDELLKMGFPVDIYTMNIAVNCCCHLKDIYSGFAVMAFFFKSGYELDIPTFNTLIKGLFLENKGDEAVKLFEKILDLKLCEPNEIMISHLIDGLCKTGHTIAAHDWLRRSESSGWRLIPVKIDKGISPDVVSYTSVIKGLCENGRQDFV